MAPRPSAGGLAAPSALSPAASALLSWGMVPKPSLIDLAPAALGCSPESARLAAWGLGVGLVAAPLVYPEGEEPGVTVACALLGMMVGLELPAVERHPEAAVKLVLLSEYLIGHLLAPGRWRGYISPRTRAILRLVRMTVPPMVGAYLIDS